MRRWLIILALAGCGPATPPPAGPVAVKAVRREFTSTVLATGAIKPQVGSEVRVGSRVSGRVVRLHANIRDRVWKNQVIAEIEKEELEAVAAQRQAELGVAEAKLASVEAVLPREIERAEAEVARWEATVDLARKELGRQEELIRQEFTTLQARDQAHERLLTSQAQLAAARKALDLLGDRLVQETRLAKAQVEAARAALESARVQLSYTVLVAPIDGVIGSVSTQEGETVAAGLNAPTFVTIVDLARLQVDAYVDEVDIGKVQVGQRAAFTVEAFPAVDFEGRVVAIYPKAVIVDNVVKYIVAVEITSPYDGKLRPEMTASVTIFLETRTVLAIPSKAVRREHGKYAVTVRAAGKGEPREVRIGWKDGPWVEVVSGLREGEEVEVDAAN